MRERAFAPMNMENNFGRHDQKFRSHDLPPQTWTDILARMFHLLETILIEALNMTRVLKNERDSNFHNDPSFRNHQYPDFRSHHDKRNHSFDD
uniref:Uncharacterized protein n=1 Tax=Arundo donax TaxID=35708 RepID=A0A0A9DHP7_ARUDO